MDYIKLQCRCDNITIGDMLAALRLKEGCPAVLELGSLLEHARKVSYPTAVYKPVSVTDDGSHIYLAEYLAGDFLSERLRKSPIAIPHIASCGRELEDFSKSLTDYFLQYAAEVYKLLCLNEIRMSLYRTVSQYFDEESGLSALHPGTVKDYPLSELRVIFDILGSGAQEAGVVLAPSLMMYPDKTVSGIFYQSEKKCTSCELCPHIRCENRKTSHLAG